MSEPCSTTTTIPEFGIKEEIKEDNADAAAAAGCRVKVERDQRDCIAGAIEIETNLATRIKQEEECLIDCSEDEFMSEIADDGRACYNIYDVYELDTKQEAPAHGPGSHRSSVNMTEDKGQTSSVDSESLSSGSEFNDYSSEESSDDEYVPTPRKPAPNRRRGKQQLTRKATAAGTKRIRKRKISIGRDERRQNRERGSAELQRDVMQKMNDIAEVAKIYRNPNRRRAHARSKHAPALLSRETRQSRLQTDRFLRENFLIWLCPVCDAECQSKHKWRQHLGAMHQMLDRETLNMDYLPNSKARCRQCCEEISSRFWTVLMHEVTHLPHPDFLICKLCHCRSGSMRGALLHLRREHADETAERQEAAASVNANVSICPFCQRTFPENTLMMAHIKWTHEHSNATKAVYWCPECEQRFREKLDFHKHLVEAHNYNSPEKSRCVELELARDGTVSRAFRCLQCAVIEPKPAPAKILEHALRHSGVKCFQCVYCERSFESSKELRVHFCAELRQKFLDAADAKPRHKKPKFIRYLCPMCGEEAASKTKRAKHEESVHNMGTPGALNFAPAEESGDGKNGTMYKCTVCEKKVGLNLVVMYQHAVIHMPHNRWKCGRCDTSFRRLQDTYVHDCRATGRLVRNNSKHVYVNKFDSMVSHVCPLCNADFAHRRYWWQHLKHNHALGTLADMRMEGVDNRYVRCLDCNALVGNRYTTRREHRFQHLAYKTYRCIGCAETFGTLRTISRHVIVCSRGVDSKNGETSLPDSLLKELPVSTKEQPAPPAHIEHNFVKITCLICDDVSFKTLLEQLAHFGNVHNHFSDKYTLHTNGSMNCQMCGKYFQDSAKMAMIRHQRSHIVKNCFHCLQCGFSAHTLNILRGHISTQHGEELKRLKESAVELAETVDPLEAADDNVAQTSKTRIAVKAANASVQPVYSQFAEYISYACPECNEPLPTVKDWQAHINGLHSFFNEEEMHLQFTEDGNMVCTDCGVNVSHSIFQQQRHKLTHMPYKSFICTICTHRSNTIGVLIQHLRRRHFTPGQYKCEVCSQVFGNSYERYKHIKEQHDPADWPLYMCRICCAVLKSKSVLMDHLDTHDPNRQMFPCATCNCQYSSLSELRRHLRACHPDQEDQLEKTKVHKCAVCEENLESVKALIAHMQRHDAAEIPDTVCQMCGKTFKTAKSCTGHKRNVHKSVLSATDNSAVNVNESTGRKRNRQKRPTQQKTNENEAKPSTSAECRDGDAEDVEMIVPHDN